MMNTDLDYDYYYYTSHGHISTIKYKILGDFFIIWKNVLIILDDPKLIEKIILFS